VSATRRRVSWTILTNHGQVLACLAEQPDIRARDLAVLVGITERAAQAIVSDLVLAGYVTRSREGRRNRYEVDLDSPLRHPLEGARTVGDLLAGMGKAIARPGVPARG
jgi:hypothetical protein